MCHTRGEDVTRTPPPSANKAASLALKYREDITRSAKQEYQWSHKKDLCPQIFFLKISDTFTQLLELVFLCSQLIYLLEMTF